MRHTETTIAKKRTLAHRKAVGFEPDETNEEAVIMRRVVRYLLAYSQALARKKAAREGDNKCV